MQRGCYTYRAILVAADFEGGFKKAIKINNL